MKAPETVLTELLREARAILYSALPERSWFVQQARVKAALTLPAAWLDERKVEVSAERYQAILMGILTTIKTHGKKPGQLGPYPCAYLHYCVAEHMKHHGDEYYEEGKGVRNLLKAGMSTLERAQRGADSTVPTFAMAHAALQTGKRRAAKPVKTASEPDLFTVSSPKKGRAIAKLGSKTALPEENC